MVKLKQEEEAMRFLCDYYEHYPESRYVTIPSMHSAGIKNADAVVDVLEAKGLVTVRKEYKEANRSEYPVRLTSKGKSYFSEKQEEKRISKRQFLHDALIAVIGAVVGALLTFFSTQRSDGSETSSV